MNKAQEVLHRLISRAAGYRYQVDAGPITTQSSEYRREMAALKVGQIVLESSKEDREALSSLTEADIQEIIPVRDVNPMLWYSKTKPRTRQRIPFYTH